MFGKSKKPSRASTSLPSLEKMEDRILLTTITVPAHDGPNPYAWFIYQNTQNHYNAIRMWNDTNDVGTIEIMQYIQTDGDISNISGQIFDANHRGDPVNGTAMFDGLPSPARPLNVDMGSIGNGPINALAFNGAAGIWYFYDNAARALIPRTAAGVFGSPIPVQNGATTYTIDGMTYIPAGSHIFDSNGVDLSGKLLGVGSTTAAPAAGPYLIVIDPATGNAYLASNNVVTATSDIATDGRQLIGTNGGAIYRFGIYTSGVTGMETRIDGTNSNPLPLTVGGATGLAYDFNPDPTQAKWWYTTATGGYSSSIALTATWNALTPGQFTWPSDFPVGAVTDLAGGIGADGLPHVYGTYSTADFTDLFEIKPPPQPTEIYMLYIAQSDIFLHIDFASNVDVTFDNPDDPTIPTPHWGNENFVYSSGSTMLLQPAPNAVPPIAVQRSTGGGDVLLGGILEASTAGAGGGAAGAVPLVGVAALTTGPLGTRADDGTFTPTLVSDLGVWPGGEIHAGIMMPHPDIAHGVYPQDVGAILLPGTLAGSGDITGSIRQWEVGYLWGDINIGYDMGDLEIMTDAGWSGAWDGTRVEPDHVRITSGGSIRSINIHAIDAMTRRNSSNGVNAGGDDALPPAALVSASPPIVANINNMPIEEWESHPDVNWLQSTTDFEIFLTGKHYNHANDTIPPEADISQWVSSESGNFSIWGNLDAVDPFADTSDYYKVILTGSQTIDVSAYYNHVTRGTARIALSTRGANVELIRIDNGVPVVVASGDVFTFTVPQPALYYIHVVRATEVDIPYTLFVEGTFPSGALGQYQTGSWGSVVTANGSVGAILTNVAPDMTFRIHGNLGGFFAVRGLQYPGSFGWSPFPTNPHDAPSMLIVDGNIGIVYSDTEWNGTLVAGADYGRVNNNAYIQNVILNPNNVGIPSPRFVLRDTGPGYASAVRPGTLIHGIWSSGNIGIVSVGGPANSSSVQSNVDFTINGDDDAPATTINYADLITVKGVWNNPRMIRGRNADFRMLNVEGAIQVPGSNGLLGITVADGSSTQLQDDSGGQMTITPGRQIGAAGVRTFSSYTYTTVPVYPVGSPNPGIGEVIARLVFNGPVTAKLDKPDDVVEIGRLTLTGIAPVAGSTVTTGGDFAFTGTGKIDVYYAQGTNLNSFVNSTTGDLMSGDLTFTALPTGANGLPLPILSFQGIKLGGSLGRSMGNSREYVLGRDSAPAGSHLGWDAGMLDGLTITGDVDSLIANGHIGDILSSGGMRLIKADADGTYHPTTDFQGIVGVIHSTANGIGEIDVGDGLADSGLGLPFAAIFSDTWIDKISIDGKDKFLRGIICASADHFVNNVQVPAINLISVRHGATYSVRTYSYTVDTQAATYSSAIAQPLIGGGVGTIDVGDAGSSINGGAVHARYARKIAASANSGGISGVGVYLLGQDPTLNLSLGEISVGGPGMSNSVIQVTDGRTGVIHTNSKTADLTNNTFRLVNDGAKEISGRDVSNNTFSIGGKTGTLKSTRDMIGNNGSGTGPGSSFGSIGNLTVGRNFIGNDFNIATSLDNVKIGGDFQGSNLLLSGVTVTRLGKMDVGGSISGTIQVDGNVGAITSRNGDVSADITITHDLQSLSAANGGIRGNLVVDGKVGSISSKGGLGVDPTTISNFTPREIRIGGNLGSLKITAPRGQISNLYSTVNVGGDLGAVTVAGNLYADLLINGSLGSLVLNGDMGGTFNIPNSKTLGNVTVLGTLGKFSMAAGSSIIGDLTVGGNISQITLSDKFAQVGIGDIVGDITSLHGSIAGISLTNGVLKGDVTAGRNIGAIVLKGSSVDRSDVQGKILAQAGGVASVTVLNGDVTNDIVAQNANGVTGGDIGAISVTNGGIFGGTIMAYGRLGKLSLTGGDWQSGIEGAGLDSLTIKGGGLSGDVTIDGDASKISISGTASSNMWINGLLGNFTAGAMGGATLGTLVGATTITVAGNVVDSSIIGGFNADPSVADGDPLKRHSANFGTVTVGGNWDSSLLAAGVEPGAGGDFQNPVGPTPGLSSLKTLTVKGVLLTTSNSNLVTANTSVGIVPAGMPTALVTSGEPVLVGTALVQGLNTLPNGLIVKFTGDGAGAYDDVTGRIILNDTTGKTKLAVSNSDPSNPLTVSVIGGDDDMLSNLTLMAGVVLADVNLDGGIATIQAGDVNTGAAWNLPGGVNKLTTNELTNVNVSIGSLGTFTVNGDITGATGQVNVDKLVSMMVKGKMAVPLTSLINGMGSVTATGELSGNVTSRGTIGGIKGAPVSGDITVTNGDLKTLTVTGDYTGDMTVESGSIGSIKITGGSFADPQTSQSFKGDGATRTWTLGFAYYHPDDIQVYIDDALVGFTLNTTNNTVTLAAPVATPSSSNVITILRAENTVRSLKGITSFSVAGGNAYGQIITNGALGSLTVSGKPAPQGTGTTNLGLLQSRVLARGGIGKVTADTMLGALISSLGDIGSVTVKGDMISSDIAAGLDTGDAGYDAANGGEAANVMFDGRTNSAWRSDGNHDLFGGGSIGTVSVGNQMIASSIAAGVAPGADGYFGTPDDEMGGTGSIKSVSVKDYIYGSGTVGEHYAIIAASSMPTVKTRRIYEDSNFAVASGQQIAGSPHVTKMEVFANRIVIHFDHNIDMSTITTQKLDPSVTDSSLKILASTTGDFTSAFNVTDNVDNIISYDMDLHTLTVRLDYGTPNTWEALGEGNYFRVILDGSVVADQRGNLLDGEYDHQLPSGNGQAGGDFSYTFIQGEVGHSSNTALNLTTGGLVDYNHWLTLTGNLRSVGVQDFYSVHMYAGDVLYLSAGSIQLSPRPDKLLVQSRSGQGWYAVGSLGTISTGPINALAYDAAGSTWYVYDDLSHSLIPRTNSGVQPAIPVHNGATTYTIGGMTYIPAGSQVSDSNGVNISGKLLAIGWTTGANPAGPYLIVINPNTGSAYLAANAVVPNITTNSVDLATDGHQVIGTNGTAVFRFGNFASNATTLNGTTTAPVPLTTPSGGVTGIAYDGSEWWMSTATDIYYSSNPLSSAWAQGGKLASSNVPGAVVTDLAGGAGRVFATYSTTGFTDLRVIGFTAVIPVGANSLNLPFGYTGAYNIDVMLFNDHNSNFNFDDPSQMPTGGDGDVPTDGLQWVGSNFQIPSDFQEIIASDDVDIYNLGELSSGTQLNVALDTILVGSRLNASLAVFNANGDIIGNLVYNTPPESTDIAELKSSITLQDNVYLPSDGVYYVAVEGRSTSDAGKYQLSISKATATVDPTVSRSQVVYLNFQGGDAPFLIRQLSSSLGGNVPTTLAPINITQFGLTTSQLGTLENLTLQRMQHLYADYSNITFTLVKPTSGEYSTIYMSGTDGPPGGGAAGIAEQIDDNNQDHTDSAVLFTPEYAIGYGYSTINGFTIDEIGLALGNVASHELGHILGLDHTNNYANDLSMNNQYDLSTPILDVMNYWDRMTDKSFTNHSPMMRTPNYQFLIGYQDYGIALSCIA